MEIVREDGKNTRASQRVNFSLQLLFVTWVMFVFGLVAIRKGPPAKPIISVAEAKARTEYHTQAKKEADARLANAQRYADEVRDSQDKVARTFQDQTQAAARAAANDVHALVEALNEDRMTLDKARTGERDYDDSLDRYRFFKWLVLCCLPLITCLFFVMAYYATSTKFLPFTILVPKLLRTAEPPPPIIDAIPENAAEVLHDSMKASSSVCAKMERRTSTHLLLAMFIGLMGVAISLFTQYYLPPFYAAPSFSGSSWNWFWFETQSFNQIPRIAFLIFMEILAGYFLTQYRAGVEDLKIFIDLEHKARMRAIAYFIYKEETDSNSRKRFGEAIFTETPCVILKEGETTPAIKVLDQQAIPSGYVVDILKQAIDVLGKLTELSESLIKKVPH